MDFEDNTGEDLGNGMGASVSQELEKQRRFQCITQKELGIASSVPFETLDRLKREFQVDAFVTGSLSLHENKLNISAFLITAHSWEVVAVEYVVIANPEKKEKMAEGIQKLVSKLIGRIPYKALVTEINGRKITINAGKFHGLKIGDRATIFKLVRTQHNPVTKEIVAFKSRKLGEAILTEVNQFSSAGNLEPSDGPEIKKNNKVTFIPGFRGSEVFH